MTSYQQARMTALKFKKHAVGCKSVICGVDKLGWSKGPRAPIGQLNGLGFPKALSQDDSHGGLKAHALSVAKLAHDGSKIQGPP